jgi:hypothetical protein
LRDALALTLKANPELAAFSHEVRATEAALLQADVIAQPGAGNRRRQSV